MLEKLDTKTDSKKLYQLLKHLPEGKNVLNKPTGDFFYDPWEVLPEYKDTVLDELLQQLPDHGEARLIVMKPGESYSAHADIDDRYHVTLDAEHSYLHDIENEVMFPTQADDSVYLMNTGLLHSASNYGYKNRYQLVIRKRLKNNSMMKDPRQVLMTVKNPVYNMRYLFDSSFSRLLNRFVKEGKVNNFARINETTVKYLCENDSINEILRTQQICGFDIDIVYG
jgi:hypothetical protein